jgi:hypothetical protein
MNDSIVNTTPDKRFFPGRSPAPRMTRSDRATLAFGIIGLTAMGFFVPDSWGMILMGFILAAIVSWEGYKDQIVDGTIVLYDPPMDVMQKIAYYEKEHRLDMTKELWMNEMGRVKRWCDTHCQSRVSVDKGKVMFATQDDAETFFRHLDSSGVLQ